MKRRFGMIGAVCLLGLGTWFGSNDVSVEAQSVMAVGEENFSGMFMPDGQANEGEEGPAQGSEAGEETESAQESEIGGEEESEQRNEAGEETESVQESEAGEETESVQESEAGTETESVQESEDEPKEEFDLIGSYAIADVDRYVNVRNEPSTEGEVVGKIYDDAVAEIIAVDGENEDWFQITSGNVEGYVKSEFFLYGEAATEVLDQYVISYAKVEADRLNVRAEQSTDSACIGHLNNGEKVKLLEDCGEWIQVQYTEQKRGYVSAEYVVMVEEYSHAKTLEEDRAELAARQEKEDNQKIPEMTGVFPATSYTSNEELRTDIVNYAMQYVGNRYINGGTSLSGGTDCSGFTCFIYKDFGYSISRTPEGQFSGAGRSIDYSEIQPGDIICYSSNGGKSCTHVALYIGDGQIVHAANSRKGVITGAADYEPIIGIRNVID